MRALAVDALIAEELASLSDADDDYWTFRRGAARRQAHGLSQYPAMMVPPMQAVLMGVVAQAVGDIDSVIDPFVGSGTTLTEAMRLGLSFSGQDINPLAVLISRTKAGPFHLRRLRASAERVVALAGADRGTKVETDFPGIDKWFQPAVAVDLSRIRRAIRTETSLWCRRVLWTALAETVRLSSNSRTSTFKLHIRSADDLEAREVQAVETFTEVLNDVVQRLTEEAATLRESGHLAPGGAYRGRITIDLGDSMDTVPSPGSSPRGHGLLITSPPYGDNTTTVPYGQYSYLPLQWIDLEDIHDRTDSSYLVSTYEIDSRSLGGGRKSALEDVAKLREDCPSLDATLKRLARLPADRSSRVAAFCRDLDSSLDAALAALRTNGYMIWTVGNRRVGGDEVPTDQILTELLGNRGAVLVASIQRHIPSKRMATRNSIASTMRGETILLFRKEG
ncbi:MAG: site-specific DNA-methyltransferase [Alphaproteobacteria bacterium]|nr:site-specific DNA-methyltransferase [Alphaproteobacteria bacterium]